MKKYLSAKGFISTIALLALSASSLLPFLVPPQLQPFTKSVLGTTSGVYVIGYIYNPSYTPLGGAYVKIYNSSTALEYTTGSDGYFFFYVPSGKSYTLYSWKSGYAARNQSFSVGSSQYKTYMVLSPLSPPSNVTSGGSNNSGGTNVKKPLPTLPKPTATPIPKPRVISGTVNIVDPKGNITGPFTKGARITINNGLGGVSTITTDSKGNYRFTSNALTKNLTYTVTLKPGSGYTIVSQNPLSRSLQPGVSTTAFFRVRTTDTSGSSGGSKPTASVTQPKTIAGHVYTVDNTGKVNGTYKGATISITNTAIGGGHTDIKTDTNGYYLFTSKASGTVTYSVTLKKTANFTIVSDQNVQKTVSDGIKNAVVNFSIRKTESGSNPSKAPATSTTKPRVISGAVNIVDANGNTTGAYTKGAKITIDNGQGGKTTLTTDNKGVYTFTSNAVTPSLTYTVTLNENKSAYTIVSQNPLSRPLQPGVSTTAYFRVRLAGSSAKVNLKVTVLEPGGAPVNSITAVSACLLPPNEKTCFKDLTDNSGVVTLSVLPSKTYKVGATKSAGEAKDALRGSLPSVPVGSTNKSVTLTLQKANTTPSPTQRDVIWKGYVWYDKDNDKRMDSNEKLDAGISYTTGSVGKATTDPNDRLLHIVHFGTKKTVTFNAQSNGMKGSITISRSTPGTIQQNIQVFQPKRYSISGQVWKDVDWDGKGCNGAFCGKSDSDEPFSGITVKLSKKNSAGKFVAFGSPHTTHQTGDFAFTNISAGGTYMLEIDVPKGWGVTTYNNKKTFVLNSNQEIYIGLGKTTSTGSKAPESKQTGFKRISGRVTVVDTKGNKKVFPLGKIALSARNVDNQKPAYASFDSDGTFTIYPLRREYYFMAIEFPGGYKLSGQTSVPSVDFRDGQKIKNLSITVIDTNNTGSSDLEAAGAAIIKCLESSCTNTEKGLADLNKDGTVNEIDYNTFLRIKR